MYICAYTLYTSPASPKCFSFSLPLIVPYSFIIYIIFFHVVGFLAQDLKYASTATDHTLQLITTKLHKAKCQ